jgi:hypothetical protein
MFRFLRFSSSVVFLLALGAFSGGAPAAMGQDAEETELLELNARLFEAQIIDRDPTLLEEVALPQFHVLAPGGLIEGKDQAMAGTAAWDVTSIELSGERVIREGAVAVVMGRIDIDGTMAPVGRLAPLKYMGVFIRSDGEWRFLARSLTPCVEMLIRMGRC